MATQDRLTESAQKLNTELTALFEIAVRIGDQALLAQFKRFIEAALEQDRALAAFIDDKAQDARLAVTSLQFDLVATRNERDTLRARYGLD